MKRSLLFLVTLLTVAIGLGTGVFYYHLNENPMNEWDRVVVNRDILRASLEKYFPEEKIRIIGGSDWANLISKSQESELTKIWRRGEFTIGAIVGFEVGDNGILLVYPAWEERERGRIVWKKLSGEEVDETLLQSEIYEVLVFVAGPPTE